MQRKWITWLLFSLAAVSLLLGFVSIPQSGIGWDTLGDTNEEYYSSEAFGKESIDEAIAASACESEACAYRGLLVQQVGRFAQTALTGQAKPELSPYSIGSIRWQQVFTMLLFAGSISAVALSLFQRTRSAIFALLFLATASSTPLLVGHASMNHKDSPVLAGILLVVSQLLMIDANARWPVFIGRTIIGGVGIFVALGQRPSSVVLLGLLFVLSLAASMLRRPNPLRSLSSTIKFWLLAGAVGLVGVYLTNPFARTGIFEWLYSAARYQSKYPWGGTIRFAGGDIESLNLPFWYVPAYFWLQLPVLTSLVLAASLVIYITKIVSRRPNSEFERQLLAIGCFSFLVPVIIAMAGSPLYDGIRHVLFLLPLWMLIGAVGIQRLVSEWEPKSGASRAISIVLLLMVPTVGLVDSVRWFPYQYSYVNDLAATLPDYSWETDYWGLTAKEGVETLESIGLAPVLVEPHSGTSWWVGGRHEKHVEYLELGEGSNYGLYVWARGDLSVETFGCQPLFQIRRAGVLLGEGGVCQKPSG